MQQQTAAELTGVEIAVDADEACANSMNANEGLSFWDFRLTARGPARFPNCPNTWGKGGNEVVRPRCTCRRHMQRSRLVVGFNPAL